MGKFNVGDVLTVPFPHHDLKIAKKRPVVVLADLPGQDILICAITSKAYSSSYVIPLTDADMASSTLRVSSHARPEKLFAITEFLVKKKIGTLSSETLQRIKDTIKIILNI